VRLSLADMNIESHSLLPALDASALVSKLGGGALPASAIAPGTYAGVGRIIVPTVRNTVEKGSPLPLRVLLLAAKPCTQVTVTVKPMGARDDVAASVSLPNVGRQVYQGAIPAQDAGFEYYVSATCGAETLVFPAGAPTIMQTVVVM
jgi:hypothetical protein